MRLKITILACSACLLISCARQSPKDELPPSQLEWVLGSDGSGQPHFSKLGKDNLLLNWMQPNGDSMELVYSIVGLDLLWAEPSPIVQGDNWFVNWADLPSVVPITENIWVTHWLEYQEDYAGYDILFSVTKNTGSSWSDPRRLNEDGLPAEHGFVEIFPNGDGFSMIWLDGRGYAVDQTSDNTIGTALRQASFSFDGERLNESILDELVCDCCQPDVGQINNMTYVAYRDRSENEIRDIVMLVSKDDGEWSDPISLPEDNWQISGCPVNGPALALNEEGVGVVWFNAKNDEPQVRFAFKQHNSELFLGNVILEEYVPWGYVDIVYDELNDQFVLSWLRDGENGLQLVARSVDQLGNLNQEIIIFENKLTYPLDFPKIEIIGNYLLASWTDFTSGMMLKARAIELESLR
jgi:hypothetical protein